jgi:hypothetical protein
VFGTGGRAAITLWGDTPPGCAGVAERASWSGGRPYSAVCGDTPGGPI